MGNRIDNDWLKLRREALGLSQEEFVERINHHLGRNINRVSISHWEHNRRQIVMLLSVEETAALAKALDWSVAELLSAIGHDITAVHIEKLNIPTDVHQLLNLVLSASKSKREMILKLVKLFYDEIPDPLPDEYRIPDNAHLDGEDDNNSS